MKSPIPETQCAESIFQMQYPICAVNFTNLHKIYQGQDEHGTNFENS